MSLTIYKFRCSICGKFIPCRESGSNVTTDYCCLFKEHAPNHCGKRTKPILFTVGNPNFSSSGSGRRGGSEYSKQGTDKGSEVKRMVMGGWHSR